MQLVRQGSWRSGVFGVAAGSWRLGVVGLGSGDRAQSVGLGVLVAGSS